MPFTRKSANYSKQIIQIKNRNENKKKTGCNPIQQKARPIPYHLQKNVKNELDRLLISGNLERVETVEEDCFV